MRLGKFNIDFLNNIDGKENILVNEAGVYHTIKIEDENVGVVGFIPTKDKGGFVQIIIEPKFRGKGLLKKAEDLLAKKYKLDYLLATIEENNLISVKAHLKAGFEILPKKEIDDLRRGGLLDKNKIRMMKKY